MMKSIKKMLVSVIFLACMLSGCGSLSWRGDGRIQVVCTTFPQYDWMKNLIRGNEENISLTLLMDKGGDLHNFQPSALDIARVSECDLFIYVGGESDAWVGDALSEAVNADMHVISMMDAVSEGLVAEEELEGLSGHEGHDHDTEYDEHVWLSLRNAEIIVEDIAGELAVMDPANAGLYRQNCTDYCSELRALDDGYEKAVHESMKDTLVFADRFPFRYLVEDYGLKYYAAFEGCSAETEASFATVAFLVNKLDELETGAVIVLDGSDGRLAQVIVENTKTKHQEILVLDSMQSVSQRDMDAGCSYLSVMTGNLDILRQALK